MRGSYVVFSDHHIFDNASRQDFFAARNKGLYLDILQNHYGPDGWHLVENGDIEELLIFEPDLDEVSAGEGIGKWEWQAIWDYRAEKGRAQLERIIDDNRDYYDTIWEQFARRGRYHKLVGNHDVALLEPDLMDVIRTRTGHDFDAPDEVLLLSNNSRHRYFICHGHQFDHSCTPGLAKFFGESFSQAGGWAFEGPDRSWKWTDRAGTDVDFLQAMLRGERPVYNEMVGIEPSKLKAKDVAAIVVALGAVFGASSFPVALATATGVPALEAATGIVRAELLFEGITGKSIAMEYFENPRVPASVFEQIVEGIRWFKFRHMDELAISEMLRNDSIWGEIPVPTLVVGHSHEPRLWPRHVEGDGQPVIDTYINSGAAGRFENLIWAVEIVNGAATMVSWHYPEADPGADPVRTVWTAQDVDGRRQLVPSPDTDEGDADDADAAATAATMTAILGMMMPA